MVNEFNQLYYKDPYASEVFTEVVDQKELDGKKYLAFTNTCFYPLGGGQPGDTGKIYPLKENGELSGESIDVLGTVRLNDGIWHQVTEYINKGTKIKAVINFARRYDFMRQHSGEHILSGLVNQKYGYNNVGFHINEEETTFDFDGDLTWEQIEELEILANQAVAKNIPINIHYLTPEDQKLWTYRSKIPLDDNVRIVEVIGYDVCACAGTHVRSTAEIGFIKIINRETYKGGVRLTVLCGDRSLHYFQKLQNRLRDVSAKMSANIDNLDEAVEQKNQEMEKLKQTIKDKNNTLLDLLLKVNQTKNGGQLSQNIILENTYFDKQEWHYVAGRLAEKLDGFIALLSPQKEGRYLLYMYSENINLKTYQDYLKAEIDFKGGGNNHLLQGPVQGNFDKISEVLGRII